MEQSKIIDTLEMYHPTKSYPKRRLLPQFDVEALEPIPSRHDHADEPDRPPRGRDRATTHAEH